MRRSVEVWHVEDPFGLMQQIGPTNEIGQRPLPLGSVAT